MEQRRCQHWTDPISTGANGTEGFSEVLYQQIEPTAERQDKPNVNFLLIEADREYLDNPTLSRLCAMVAQWIYISISDINILGVVSGQATRPLLRDQECQSMMGYDV